jgi:hypothetical protein
MGCPEIEVSFFLNEPNKVGSLPSCYLCMETVPVSESLRSFEYMTMDKSQYPVIPKENLWPLPGTEPQPSSPSLHLLSYAGFTLC